MIKDLVTLKDIKELKLKFGKLGKLTSNEANILSTAEWAESKIQAACYNIVKHLGSSVVFLQIDNGGYRNKYTKMKKSREGTQSGFPDCELIIWKRIINIDNSPHFSFLRKTIYIEFKKIGGKVSKKQESWYRFLKEKGESIYFCNNITYFERVILKEIEKFLQK